MIILDAQKRMKRTYFLIPLFHELKRTKSTNRKNHNFPENLILYLENDLKHEHKFFF